MPRIRDEMKREVPKRRGRLSLSPQLRGSENDWGCEQDRRREIILTT